MTDTMQGAPARGQRGRGRQIPTWYYAVGAAGIALVYFLYSRSKTNAAAAAQAAAAQSAATVPATATPVVPASSYGNAGDLSALLPYLTNLQGAQSAATTGATTPQYTQAQITQQLAAASTPSGSGYSTPLSALQAAGLNYVPLTAATAHQLQLSNPSATVYYQPQPGIFSPIPVTSLTPTSNYGAAYALANNGVIQ